MTQGQRRRLLERNLDELKPIEMTAILNRLVSTVLIYTEPVSGCIVDPVECLDDVLEDLAQHGLNPTTIGKN